MKVCTPDRRVREIDGPSGHRYDFKTGMAEVSDYDAKAIVAEGGFIPSATGTTRAGLGFRCECGFGSWFTTCSRCGGSAVREVAA